MNLARQRVACGPSSFCLSTLPPCSSPPDLQGRAEAEPGQPGLQSVFGPQFVGFSLTLDSSLSFSSPMKTMSKNTSRKEPGAGAGGNHRELGRILGAVETHGEIEGKNAKGLS